MWKPFSCLTCCVAVSVFVGAALAEERAAQITPLQGWSSFFGGDEVKLGYRIHSPRQVRGRLVWSYVAERRTVARGERAVAADAGAPADVQIALKLPQVREGIVYDTELIAQLLDGQDRVVADHRRVVRLFSRDPFAGRQQWLGGLGLVLFDPEAATAKTFEALHIPYKTARSVSALQAVGAGIVVIGEGVSLGQHGSLPEVVVRLAASGRPVLCLAPTDGHLAFPGTEADAPSAARLGLRRNDVIVELDKRLDAQQWPPDGKAFGAGLEVAGIRGRVSLVVTESPQAWPWLDVAYPRGGRLVVCGFHVVKCWQAGPTPRYLLARILEELSPTGNAVKDFSSGEIGANGRSRSRETSGDRAKDPNSHEFGYRNGSRRCPTGALKPKED
jgi:hypothetical protein